MRAARVPKPQAFPVDRRFRGQLGRRHPDDVPVAQPPEIREAGRFQHGSRSTAGPLTYS